MRLGRILLDDLVPGRFKLLVGKLGLVLGLLTDITVDTILLARADWTHSR